MHHHHRRRSSSFLLWAGILLSVGDLWGASPALTVTVDFQQPGRAFSRDLLGVNIDTEDALEPRYHIGRYADSLMAVAPAVVRFPGGLVANSYHWADALGPVAARKAQWDWNHTRLFPPKFGTGEYLILLRQLKAAGMLTVNVCDGTPEEAVAWVAFCRGRLGDPRVIGRDRKGRDWQTVGHWAQRRAELTGIREPVDVRYVELGNEAIGGPKFTGKEFSRAEDYCKVAKVFAQTIRAIDPTILIGWLCQDKTLTTAEKHLLDFTIYHSYTGWPRYGDRIMMWQGGTLTAEFNCPTPGEYEIELKLAGHGITPPVIAAGKQPRATVGVDDVVLKTLTTGSTYQPVTVKSRLTAGKHRLQVTFTNDYTEQGEDTNLDVVKGFTVTLGGQSNKYVFPDRNTETEIRKDLAGVRQSLRAYADDLAKFSPHAFVAVTEYNRMENANFDLNSALYVAELLTACVDIPQIRTAEIWDACSWNFGIKSTTANVKRPTYYVLEMMKDLQGRVFPATVLPADPDLQLLVTKDSLGNAVAVLAINFSPVAKPLQFKLPGGGNVIFREIKYITGARLADCNEETEQVKLQTRTLPGAAGDLMLPGYSVSRLSGELRK
jgi:hypothetical protein